jgi:hypothetical protein
MKLNRGEASCEDTFMENGGMYIHKWPKVRRLFNCRGELRLKERYIYAWWDYYFACCVIFFCGDGRLVIVWVCSSSRYVMI